MTATVPVNQSGLAAVSMPMISSLTLPTGMQLIGQQGSNFHLLRRTHCWQKELGYQYHVPQAI